MNKKDKELVKKHAVCVQAKTAPYQLFLGDVIFTASGLNEFLAARDAIKHKELLQIHEVLQCIGCEHEADETDTWTVKGVKQLAERVQRAEAALNSQAKSVPEFSVDHTNDAVREALEKAADICEDQRYMVLQPLKMYSAEECARAQKNAALSLAKRIRALIEPKD